MTCSLLDYFRSRWLPCDQLWACHNPPYCILCPFCPPILFPESGESSFLWNTIRAGLVTAVSILRHK